MDEPRAPRTYSGKLAAAIVFAVVVVFVLLNVVFSRFVPQPAKPVPPPPPSSFAVSVVAVAVVDQVVNFEAAREREFERRL